MSKNDSKDNNEIQAFATTIEGMNNALIGAQLELDCDGRHIEIELSADLDCCSILVLCSEGEASGCKEYMIAMPPSILHSLFGWLEGNCSCPMVMTTGPVLSHKCSVCEQEIGDQEPIFQACVGDFVMQSPLCEYCAGVVNCERFVDRTKRKGQ